MIGQISASNQLRTSSELATNMFGASSELAPNMFGASSELASVMEFVFYIVLLNIKVVIGLFFFLCIDHYFTLTLYVFYLSWIAFVASTIKYIYIKLYVLVADLAKLTKLV